MTDMTGTANALLTLAQWLSPAFPLGGFAYSHGLEAAIAGGEIGERGDVEIWIADVLAHGSGRADAVLLIAAMAPGADHAGLAARARALAATRERWNETIAQGTAFTQTVNALQDCDDPPAALPVAVGRAAAALDVAPVQVAALYLQAFASNLALAAVRFVPLGQTEGQGIVARLRPLILRVAAEAEETSVDAISTSVPGADLAAMAHETMDVRIFKT